MRIIAGQFRGRRLQALPGTSTRPTSDKLRETLFNIMAPWMEGAVFVDCYAGTGAVGIGVDNNTFFADDSYRFVFSGALINMPTSYWGIGYDNAIDQANKEGYTRRGVAGWDVGVQSPRAAKIAGLLSILLWVAVLFLARWIGFTKAYDFSVPDDPNIQ